MLINIRELCEKYNIIPKGVIHIGAYNGEENIVYQELKIKKIIWIEAIKELSDKLKKRFENNNHIRVIQACISDKHEKVMFNIANNQASSSLLDFGTHKEQYPKIDVQEVRELYTITMDSLIKKRKINMDDYDFLNIDIQGVELKALQGFKENLKHIKYIYTEANVEELYKGCCKLDELDEFLNDFGFNRVETKILKHRGFGDVFYLNIL